MQPLTRRQIARRAAQDLQDGDYVNLGLGLPVLVADYAPAGREVMFQSENGIVGVGAIAPEGAGDPDQIDAGSQPVLLAPGAAIVDSVAAFAMIRGGHVDVTLLGAFEVSAAGDLANWDSMRHDKGQLVGGAMDLAAGARAVRVLMEHVTRDGAPRLVEQCRYPLTAGNVVSRVYTDLCVVDLDGEGFIVREIVADLGREELQHRTGAALRFAPDCGTLVAG